MKRFFAPEVVQTSNLDCGPAALKCLLEGFGTHVGYDRLREACQTSLDGTSIDTIESVATQLGLEAEQVMLPIDHVLLAESKALPAVVVVKLPTGLTHFVVAWRRHGSAIQVMDPAIGRRWISGTQLARDIFSHSMLVGVAAWREFAVSDEFQSALRARLTQIGVRRGKARRLTLEALEAGTWEPIASLDAAVRLIASLRAARALKQPEGLRLLARICDNPELIPSAYWSVRSGPADEDGQKQLFMRGAVLVRVRGKKTSPVDEPLSPELAAAVEQKPLSPGGELVRFLWQSGPSSVGTLALALAVAAGGVTVEALLFRGLFDIAGELHLAGQRLGAMAAILFFSLALLLLELPAFSAAARLGRQLENRLRIAFLSKIPKLGDRYFQSRLTSDMAERSHATHRLRHLPDLMRQLARSTFELCATAAGIIWLEPSAAPLVLLILAACLFPALMSQSLLAERDLRTRSHAAGLTRFYLDGMLGLIAIRAHGAERSLRREHEKLLGEWAQAALRLQKAVVSLEAVQFIASFGLVAWLVLAHHFQGADIGRALLVLYWALNLPVLGQDIGALARQYPAYRNLTLRLLEPLGAPEEPVSHRKQDLKSRMAQASPPSLHFRNVSVAVSGHSILEQINVEIEPGAHVAIVGRSGAGKSSLAGVLLGWLKPSAGDVLVNGLPLDCEQVRLSTAWVDPAIQLWNRSLFSNLAYGSESESPDVGRAIDAALLRSVLESLPEGLQTTLGEGGGLVSGGEGQRVRLGRAMLRQNASLVILDEPFRGLDREKRRELLRRARRFWRGCTLLCITHDLDETQEFDRVLVIERGRVIEDGTPAQISASHNSKYSQLLEAESQIRSGLWSSRLWRRIHLHSGRIAEKVPESVAERERETEVA